MQYVRKRFTKICLYCGKEFSGSGKSKFCCLNCRVYSWRKAKKQNNEK